jgi:hypothetical protein
MASAEVLVAVLEEGREKQVECDDGPVPTSDVCQDRGCRRSCLEDELG